MNAPDKATELKAAVVAVISFFTALWGVVGWLVLLLLICMIADYVSGCAAARKAGEWSSEKARAGRWHKLGVLLALMVASLLDMVILLLLEVGQLDVIFPFELHCVFTVVVALWYIFTELGSIVENAAKLGAPVPPWLAKTMAKLRTSIDEKMDAEGNQEEDL